MSAGTPKSVGVMIPTFDHGPMIRFAIRSVLDQSRSPDEVLVVGDGAPAATAETVLAMAAEDSRVRWLPYPKGERHGELHRHDVLLHRTSVDAVFYLGDDDVWFPDHLERLVPALEDRDCVFGLDIRVLPDGGMRGRVHDLSRRAYRERLLARDNRMSLSSFGHRLDAYRRLPHGWRVTPDDVNTDTYMYMQFVAAGATTTSVLVPTVLHLGTGPRRDMSLAEREAELERYAEAMADPAWRWEAVDSKLFAWIQKQAATFEIGAWDAAEARSVAEEAVGALERRVAELEGETWRLAKERDSGRVALGTLRRKLGARLRSLRSRS